MAGDTFIRKTEAEAVAQVAALHLETRILELTDEDGEKRQVIVRPDGHGKIAIESVKDHLDEYQLSPERRVGVAHMSELESFIAHVNRFKDEHSAVFADRDPRCPSLLAVLDYHEKTAEGSPRFGDHRCRYTFPVSEEWATWTKNSKQLMSQGEFAEFIETRLLDIVDPSNALAGVSKIGTAIGCKFATPGRLLELSRGLSVKVGNRVKNAQVLASGEVSFTYETTHSDETGAQLDIPGALLIGVPVFKNGAPYQLAARLRYRIREHEIKWFYELFRPEAAFDDALKEACAAAQTGTELPLFVGSPEAI